MNRLLRFSAFNLVLAGIALSAAVLTLFATPLGLAWRTGINEARTQYLQQDTQRLTEIFSSEGIPGLLAAVDRYLDMPFVPERIVFVTDASLSKLGGNLSAWPPEIPDSPGAHELSINRDGSLMHVVVIHSKLAGGQHILVGREISRFKKLESLFEYGFAGAVAAILLLGWLGGTLIRRVLLSELHTIRQTAS